MELASLFSEVFPLRSDVFELSFVAETVDEGTGEVSGGVHADGNGYWRATMRTISFERGGDGELQIRDVKEQGVVWLYPEHADDPRVPAYVAGWAAAVQYVLDRHAEVAAAGDDGVTDRLDVVMPYDCFCPSVLRLRRPQTADEFTDALLSSKSRLGKLLP